MVYQKARETIQLTLVLGTLKKMGSTVALHSLTALAISTFLTSHMSFGRKHTACKCTHSTIDIIVQQLVIEIIASSVLPRILGLMKFIALAFALWHPQAWHYFE